MPKFFTAIALGILLFNLACDDEVFETRPSTGQLEFSKDTVFLDTIFTNIGSSTRTLKVYNRSSNNISIPRVALGRGEASFYRLSVNGSPGKTFENVDIPARDSIYVFIEATVDFDRVTDPLYTDEILFDEGEREQEVKLVTLVQDAVFLFPERNAEGIRETIVLGMNEEGEAIEVEGFYLEGSQVWTDDKPYVIYGFAAVRPGHTLTVSRGARVYFHEGSGLFLETGARLLVNGTRESKVVFQGDRREEFFREIPGQWSGILMKEGSRGHRITHALIKNSVVGLFADAPAGIGGPALRIENAEIYNTSSFGLLARSTDIVASNLVIANNGGASLACVGGGDYRWIHSTFANYWSNGIRNYPAVILSNQQAGGLSPGAMEGQGGLQAYFENCIIEGNQSLEFQLEADPNSEFVFKFSNSLLRFQDPGGFFAGEPLYDFDNELLYLENVFNGEPDFLDLELGDYRIGVDSDARALGDPLVAEEVPFDLLGVDRTHVPDSGAYQHVLVEE